ncbi:hypothetical protein BDZ97DRAFT_1767486 [Flammula alnicola]|nr:hypothetical protein BDZ97DRAFT_1767486 [Flammula alnicola]
MFLNPGLLITSLADGLLPTPPPDENLPFLPRLDWNAPMDLPNLTTLDMNYNPSLPFNKALYSNQLAKGHKSGHKKYLYFDSKILEGGIFRMNDVNKDLSYMDDDPPSEADSSTLQKKDKQCINTSQNIPRASLERASSR